METVVVSVLLDTIFFCMVNLFQSTLLSTALVRTSSRFLYHRVDFPFAPVLTFWANPYKCSSPIPFQCYSDKELVRYYLNLDPIYQPSQTQSSQEVPFPHFTHLFPNRFTLFLPIKPRTACPHNNIHVLRNSSQKSFSSRVMSEMLSETSHLTSRIEMHIARLTNQLPHSPVTPRVS